MRIPTIILLGASALAGCQGADPQAELQADCEVLVTDPEAQDSLFDMNTDQTGFCTCMKALVSTKSDADQAQIQTTMKTVTDLMQENAQGAEDVVDKLMSEARANPGDPESASTRQGIEAVGRLIDDIEDAFDNGTCQPLS